MREQVDRWVGIGAIVIVPTVLVMTPWKRDEPAQVNGAPGEPVPVGVTRPPSTLPPPGAATPTPSLNPPPPLPSPARRPGSGGVPRVRPPGSYMPADTGADQWRDLEGQAAGRHC